MAARYHCAAVSYVASRWPGKPRVCNCAITKTVQSDPDDQADLGSWQPAPEHASAEKVLGTVGVARRPVGPAESAEANSAWWDADADDYHVEHGEFLGVADFRWCPEGLREAEANLLGDVRGRRVIEIG